VVRFLAGDLSKTFDVVVNGDTKLETNETLNVTLSNATNGATLLDSLGVGTIRNDDVAPTNPDLVVSSITAVTSVAKGDTFDFSFVVKNLGGTAAGLHYAGINVDGAVDESNYIDWNTVSSITANGQATFTNSIDTSDLSVGQHTLYIKDDFWQNRVGESNEGNNTRSFTFNVLNNTPDVTTHDAELGVNEWGQAFWWMDYSDPDGDEITQFSFWDGGTASNSGYFWTPDNAHHAAGTEITVAAEDLESVWFRGGQVEGSETLYVKAYDGAEWSEWMSFNMNTIIYP
jgi:hypothetical protein